MKVILSAAISANGMIAEENGSEDFLSHKNWVAFTNLANKIGNNIWGRKTYEAVKSWDGNYLNDLKDVVKVVISSDKSINHDPGFEYVSSSEEAINLLKDKKFEQVLITGGSATYSYFLSHNLVDEIILDVNPVILGKGKPVFSFDGNEAKLELLDTTKLGEGIIELHYKVIK